MLSNEYHVLLLMEGYGVANEKGHPIFPQVLRTVRRRSHRISGVNDYP